MSNRKAPHATLAVGDTVKIYGKTLTVVLHTPEQITASNDTISYTRTVIFGSWTGWMRVEGGR